MSARFYFIFLFFSFLISLGISLYFVEDQVEKSISNIVGIHTQSSADLTTSHIEQFFATRVQVAKDIANQPVLVTSAMGAVSSVARLNDYMNGLNVLGRSEPIALYDILGDQIYSSIPNGLINAESQWFKDVLADKTKSAIFLINDQDGYKFGVALPLQYNRLTEGIVVIVFSDLLDDLLGSLVSEESFNAVSINGPYLAHNTRDLDGFTSVQRLPILGTQLTVDYLVNETALREERMSVLLSVLLSVVSGLLISFAVLGLLGRQLILNPFKKLEDLQGKTQKALLDLENIRYAVDQHSIVAITDIKGTINYANEKFSQISGYKNEELVGQNHRLLNSGVHEKRFFTDMFKRISQGEVWTGEVCNRTKNGDLYWVDTTIVPLKGKDGKVEQYIAIRSDITNLKQAEKELVANGLRMQLATNSAGIGIWEWDLKTNELVWDDWMYSLYGVSPSSFSSVYEAWENSVHPDDLEESKQQLQDAIDGNSLFEPEFRVVHPNGEVKNIKAKAQVFRDGNGEPVKMIGVNYDITDRIEALDIAEDARDKAQLAAQAKSEFLANMSHEIRTPMNGVIGMLELLKHTSLTKDQSHKLKIAASSAQSLLILLNDILDLSKIEAGKLELEIIPFDLRQMLSDSIEALAHLVEESNGVQLLLDIVDINVDKVKGDPGRLRQIVTNLLSNAIKFTSQGEIILRARLVEQACDNWRFECSISDTGIGIPDSKVESLFEQFTQVDASTTRKFGGTGLGLSIAHQLCLLMNGDISVQSVEGEGSCFTFEVDLDNASDHNDMVFPSTMQNMNVLIVDGNTNSRSILERQIDVWGGKAKGVVNAEAALSLLPSQSSASDPFPYDYILIDSRIDGISANDLCVLIASRAQFANVKIILLAPISSRGNDELPQIDKPVRIVQKPVIPSMLWDAMIEANFEANGIYEHKSGDSATTEQSVERLGSDDMDISTPSAEHNTGGRKLFSEGTKVLLVEDNKINQMVAQSLLSGYGLDVEIAENGNEAIKAIGQDESTSRFKLVLMDCHMPEKDGYEATQDIRNGAAGNVHSHIPIIAMTANAMQGDREKCTAAGMDDYLTKPIDEKLLQNALIKWINGEVRPSHVNANESKDLEANIESETETKTERAEVKGNDQKFVTLPTWDKDRLLKSLLNDDRRLTIIVSAYLENEEMQKNQLVDCINTGDLTKIALLAHSIKGSVASMGAEKLGAILAEIEATAKQSDASPLPGLMDAFNLAYEEFNQVLNDYLEDDK